MHARDIIAKFGGQSALANLIGKSQSTVSYWVRSGNIPSKYHALVLDAAARHGVRLGPEDFVHIKNSPATTTINEINNLTVVVPSKPATPTQARLDLGIQKQVEIDGIGMGVLSDGTPFLTGRGVARLCGVAHSVIQDLSVEFEAQVAPPRATRIREIMASHGESASSLYIAIQQRSGVFHAYSDAVCLAILEYYSFDAGSNIREEAKSNYRLLAGKALREFIYTQVGYDPNNALPAAWQQFHDRVSLTYNSVPRGYFGIFKEIADMIVTLGQAGLHIDSNFVPDISVGQGWGKHWTAMSLSLIHGERVKFEHNYPDYFPQSASNPQEPWCYPEAALGEFRRWFREVYVGQGKFKNYVEGKARERLLPISFAQLAIAAYTRD